MDIVPLPVFYLFYMELIAPTHIYLCSVQEVFFTYISKTTNIENTLLSILTDTYGIVFFFFEMLVQAVENLFQLLQ